MAERPHSHGLFGDADNANMGATMKELNEYSGNIWTHIISLKRGDVERLGYDHAKAWINLFCAHRNEIAEAMHIPPGDFRWYGAFHNEGDHPHVHMMAWSAKPGQAYLSKEGIRKIKSVLTNDIFKQEMLHTYPYSVLLASVPFITVNFWKKVNGDFATGIPLTTAPRLRPLLFHRPFPEEWV